MGALIKSNSNTTVVFNPATANRAGGEITNTSTGSHGAAYAGLYLFVMLLYLRPNELFPGVFGEFPIAKIVAIVTLLAYTLSKLSSGEKITEWPLELKMVITIFVLGILFIPVASSSKDSIDFLKDTYSKVVMIFIIFINLVNTRARLMNIMKLTIFLGTWIAIDAINKYRSGDFMMENLRIMGAVGGMFSNPNDLAISFDLLLPLTVVLMLLHKGLMRLAMLFCSLALVAGVVVTFSRGGFLGLAAAGGLMMWKMGKGNRIMTIISAMVLLGVFVVSMPGSYGDRLLSISSENMDKTGSSWERKELMKRAFEVAIHHPVVGVGMNNFHIFSIKEKVAHNSYLEIWAELGLTGLIAYLVLMFAPMRSLSRVEDESSKEFARDPSGGTVSREIYLLSIGIQATFAAYLICSFFGSVQYLWHVYFLAGYAVAVRVIWQMEKTLMADAGNKPDLKEKRTNTGSLWKSYRLRSAFR
ncbi:MAG: O-antigen ligase family protein [Blastocatellales bacterium]